MWLIRNDPDMIPSLIGSYPVPGHVTCNCSDTWPFVHQSCTFRRSCLIKASADFRLKGVQRYEQVNGQLIRWTMLLQQGTRCGKAFVKKTRAGRLFGCKVIYGLITTLTSRDRDRNWRERERERERYQPVTESVLTWMFHNSLCRYNRMLQLAEQFLQSRI